ncbi:MAG: hypothetical protein JWN76_2421 [Chitinophagaceae bacterium]|nr:hypothetical protein [Chitinophagaceae bacterium]
MKKLSLVLAFALGVAAVNAQTATTGGPVTQAQPAADINKLISFTESDHDFGKIPYGKPAEYELEVKNISNEPIKIENVQPGCGCTTPKYEKDKVLAPGETAKITLGFSGYADGKFEKYVNVFFSGGLNKQIKFHGETVKPADPVAPAATSKGSQK